MPEFRRAAERLREIGANLEIKKSKFELGRLARPTTIPPARADHPLATPRTIAPVSVGTIVGAVAALTRFFPAAPIIHQ